MKSMMFGAPSPKPRPNSIAIDLKGSWNQPHILNSLLPKPPCLELSPLKLSTPSSTLLRCRTDPLWAHAHESHHPGFLAPDSIFSRRSGLHPPESRLLYPCSRAARPLCPASSGTSSWMAIYVHQHAVAATMTHYWSKWPSSPQCTAIRKH